MTVPEGYPHNDDLLRFSRKTKTRFTNLIENEIERLGSIITQFALIVKFSITIDKETDYMGHHFKDVDPVIIHKNNEATENDS